MKEHWNVLRVSAVAAALLGVLALPACSPVVEPLVPIEEMPAGAFATDSGSYTAKVLGMENGYTRYGFTLVSRYTNRSSRKLYIARCVEDSPTPVYGVASAALGIEGRFFNPVWTCTVHSNQFVLEPGAERVDTLLISGPNATDPKTHLPISYDDLGVYQLVYDVRLTPGVSGLEAPYSYNQSNVFLVTRER